MARIEAIATPASQAGLATARQAYWQAYLALCKPRVVALMMFTVVVGMLLATPVLPPWQVLLFGTLGVGAVAAAAAALNHLVDRRIDAIMARTRARPLPRGTLGVPQVLLFTAAVGSLGMVLLLTFTNTLCAVLTLASLLGYAVVYSLWLKHATPQNIVIGGAAGAAPPLLGWVGVTGQVDPGAWLLFLIILVWTPPHFWALAIHRKDEYAKADVPMLPVTHGVAFTQRRILQYTVLLVAVSLLPWAIALSSWAYLAGALLLGARYLQQARALQRDSGQAMAAFRYSIVYLFGLFALLLADHYLLI